MNDLILQPSLFMGALSLVMMLLMYMTRIPAAKVLEAEGLDLQKLSHPAQLGGGFPMLESKQAFTPPLTPPSLPAYTGGGGLFDQEIEIGVRRSWCRRPS